VRIHDSVALMGAGFSALPSPGMGGESGADAKETPAHPIGGAIIAQIKEMLSNITICLPARPSFLGERRKRAFNGRDIATCVHLGIADIGELIRQVPQHAGIFL
jgi:hypothetical protein